MKSIIVLLISFAGTTSFAANYQCRDIENGNVASLSISSNQILWSEDFHSASSRGLDLGVENAPYSKLLGFQIFRLTDFYTTDDSSNILAVSPDVLNSESQGLVTTYFDNDGHDEEVTSYNCQRIQ